MATRLLTDYKSPVISAGIRDTLISFMPPGRYQGFDKLVAGSSGSNPIKVKIEHDKMVMLSDNIPYAALFSPQGLLVFTDDTLEGSLPENTGTKYQCYLAYAQVNLDTSIPENSSWSMLIDMAVIEVDDYTTVDMYAHLPDPSIQMVIGLVVVPSGGSVVGDVIYVKYPQQPFGWETAYSDELAWRTQDNLFHGVNIVEVKESNLGSDLHGNVLALYSQDTIVIGTSSTSITDIQRYKSDGSLEPFEAGTIVTLTFNENDNMFDGDPLSSIYLPDGNNFFKVEKGSYQLFKHTSGKWFFVSGFYSYYAKGVKKVDKTWNTWTVDPGKISDWCTAASFQYYIDAQGDLHFQGSFLISAPESSGFKTTDPFTTHFIPGNSSTRKTEAILASGNDDQMESPHRVFLEFRSGMLYMTAGSAGAGTNDLTFYVPETIVSLS